jgi:hypothetical protein
LTRSAGFTCATPALDMATIIQSRPGGRGMENDPSAAVTTGVADCAGSYK